MLKKDRYSKILAWFEENQPLPTTELHHDSPFHLLIAVILSAQCTDRRVNMVVPPLFERFPNPEDLAKASLVSDFESEVPSDIDQLMSLPGVGRKTANVIASIVYDKPVIAVDTHVFRVSHRLGLSDGKTVEAVGKELEKHIPEHQRAKSHHWLILHGRYICVARKPKCQECPLKDWCREYERENRKII